MRKVVVSVICLTVIALAASTAMAGELKDTFEQAICENFNVKQVDVDIVRNFGISDEDLAVVFHVAKRGKIAPERIAEMRAQGDSWVDLVRGRNMNVEMFFIPISGTIDSYTYAPILEQYRATPQSQWNQMPLSDADVVNMVNLRMVASGFDYNIFKVMTLRDNGKDFVQICHEIKEAKDVMLAQQRTERRSVANAGL